MTTISIALATFNGAAFLHEQLASLSAQTRLPDELVVSDDGSTDGTLDIVREYAGNAPFPVRILPPASQLGAADNFLRIAVACTGDLIAFADQDDVWHPDKLATALARIEADGTDLAIHVSTLTDAALHPIGTLRQGIRRSEIAEPLALDVNTACWGNTMLFRRALVTLVDPARRPHQLWKSERMLHDTWIYLLAIIFGRVSLIDRPLCFYRQHGSNVTGGQPSPSWMRRLRQMRYVPLFQFRLRSDLYRAIAGICETVDDPAFAHRARAGALCYAARHRLAEARVRAYAESDPFRRLAAWRESARLSRHPAAPPDAGPLQLAYDLLFGVLRLGAIDDQPH